MPIIEVCGRAGRRARAQQEVSAALTAAEETGERAWEPELYRLRGELVKGDDKNEAEFCFTRAIEIARSQSSKSFELGAAMSPYRLRSGTKKGKEACQQVSRLYSAFTEGFETGDLIDSKAIIERA